MVPSFSKLYIYIYIPYIQITTNGLLLYIYIYHLMSVIHAVLNVVFHVFSRQRKPSFKTSNRNCDNNRRPVAPVKFRTWESWYGTCNHSYFG